MRPVIGITSYAQDAQWGVWHMPAALVPLIATLREAHRAGRRIFGIADNDDRRNKMRDFVRKCREAGANESELLAVEGLKYLKQLDGSSTSQARSADGRSHVREKEEMASASTAQWRNPRVFAARSGMAAIWRWMKIVERSQRSNRCENALEWRHGECPPPPAVLGV